MNYNKINNITGWLVFLIATAVYVLTLEPTGSFWDCGEFIATSYKLMIPHPPGAPLFLLLGRMFSFFALGDTQQVAYWINMVSALSSSFTILFLFWTITMLAKKLVTPSEDGSYSLTQKIAIMGSGIVGSLAFTFSDSFWFSSEEAEVYAMSSFFTAIVFWVILKWETKAGKPGADRWLVLLAYLVGLSIGVHLLNLVALPAIAFVYYFKKYQPTISGIAITFVISAILIVALMSGVITGLPSIASSFEVFFVNSLGLPFGSGITFFCLLLIGALVYGIFYSVKTGKEALNTALLGVAFILIGYASYGVIVIRSQFEPTIDMNNPENIMSFVSYLKREQYGDRPLLKGPVYSAGYPISAEKKEPLYRKVEDKYEIYDYKMDYQYDKKHLMLLPRMYSTQPHHVQEYKRLMGIKTDRKPTFGENISYMVTHQIGFFWGRYFLWNYAGRAGSDYGSGALGVSDWFKKDLPEQVTRDKARNNYFMLPLFLGLLGLVYHFMRDVKNAAVVGMFFFFTGIALVLYLNQPPIEPRERDYTHVGSFYAFAIWIGLGVMFINDLLSRVLKNSVAQPVLATLLGLVIPGIMMAEGWDDHDRSKRYHSVDSAINLLNSCAPNAILFTGGDNDTYPLWYAQEVEGIRTDVRVCNLSLLNTDWYINQMRRKAYESQPLPITLDEKNYLSGTNDMIYFYEDPKYKAGISLAGYIRLVNERSVQITQRSNSGDALTIYPSKTFILPVDKDKVIQSGIIDSNIVPYVVDRMTWTLSGERMDKKSLIILDMIANNNWERPIYFSTTLSGEDYMNLREYMQLEGLAYRLLPAKIPGVRGGWINSSIMYDNMMTRFAFRNMDDSTIFYDENYLRFPANARNQYQALAGQLIAEGKIEKAREVLNYSLTAMPDRAIPYDYYIPSYISLLYKVGEDKKAEEITQTMSRRALEMLEYMDKNRMSGNSRDYQMSLAYLDQIVNALREAGKAEEAGEYYEKLIFYYQKIQ
jgi:hypothetical protein